MIRHLTSCLLLLVANLAVGQEVVVTVTATGDPAIDTAAIQTAVDSVTFAAGGRQQGVVRLKPGGRGYFAIDKTIVVSSPDNTKRTVALHGDPDAAIVWRGPEASDYMIRMYGDGRTAMSVLSGLRFYGDFNCRGVLIVHQCYANTVERLYFYRMQEVALDMKDCWGASVRQVKFANCSGACLRASGANSCAFEQISFSGYGMRHRTLANTESLVRSVMSKGREATQQAMGGDWLEDWPEETPVNRRAAVQVGGSLQRWQNIQFENCWYGDYPLVATGGTGSHWTSLLFESNLSKIKVLLSGGDKANAVMFQTFEQINIRDGKHPVTAENQADYFMQVAGGHTAGLRVSRLNGHSIKYGIVLIDGGEHWRPEVVDCTTWLSSIHPSSWIQFQNDPVIHDTLPWNRPIAESLPK